MLMISPLNWIELMLFSSKWENMLVFKTLRSIYIAIFDSYLLYCCLFWAQNCSIIQRIIVLRRKAIGIINFQPRNFDTSTLFKQNSILKFQDKICLWYILFISKSLNNLSPSVFNTWFVFSLINITTNPEAVLMVHGNVIKLSYQTKRFRKYSITVSAVEPWNKIKKQLKYLLLRDLSPNKIKAIVSDLYLNSS